MIFFILAVLYAFAVFYYRESEYEKKEFDDAVSKNAIKKVQNYHKARYLVDISLRNIFIGVALALFLCYGLASSFVKDGVTIGVLVVGVLLALPIEVLLIKSTDTINEYYRYTNL